MSPVARTAGGEVEGRDGEVLLFAGIPYAAAPVGERRFLPPEPHPGWSGRRDATRFGPAAVQVGDSLGSIGAAAPPDWSEDCLFLNVQTPALDDGRRPVLVWIHGGAFVNGTGAIPWYDGSSLVRRGNVVVVTINYRLGLLGWLHLGHLDPDFDLSGNCGLLDQVAALRWVHENIAAFGGDPANVTIFGESAGAMSVATLLGTPAAAGLFHRAIAQSGAAYNVVGLEHATTVADLVVKELGGGGLDALRQAPAARLLEVQRALTDAAESGRLPRRPGSAAGLPFGPVLDGATLPRPPQEAVADGAAAGIPLLTGTNRDEWNLFALARRPVADEDALLRRVGRLVDGPAELIAGYRERRPDATADALHNAIMTDRVFRIPALRLAEAQAVHQPDHTFVYLFEWPTPVFDGRLGSCHALEIPFVFDTLDRGGVDLLLGTDRPRGLADEMADAWVAFARTGSPAHPGLPGWPAYELGRRPTMVFGLPSRVEDDPDGAERALWEGRL